MESRSRNFFVLFAFGLNFPPSLARIRMTAQGSESAIYLLGKHGAS
jgi:hypothetical protein